MIDDRDNDDGELSPEQECAVGRLTPADVETIDAALLAQVTDRWKKIAFIVGQVMLSEGPERRHGVPDIYYASRVRELVRKGLIEGAGNLRRMRFSEVRRCAPRRRDDCA